MNLHLVEAARLPSSLGATGQKRTCPSRPSDTLYTNASAPSAIHRGMRVGPMAAHVQRLGGDTDVMPAAGWIVRGSADIGNATTRSTMGRRAPQRLGTSNHHQELDPNIHTTLIRIAHNLWNRVF
ncbi:hypothetical protein [Xanthomonas sp. GPE 39]|uniref:hypothetical protein n=1 Tax=Xanthomonas sp. GPE 39 TaxID=1583099 RepID=UPI001269D7A8|nr:hypothetical protein [Xanthomonas sp. GPE 39]